MASKLAAWSCGDDDFMERLSAALGRACSEDPLNNVPEFIWEAVNANGEDGPGCIDIALSVLKDLEASQGGLGSPLSKKDLDSLYREPEYAYCVLMKYCGTPNMDMARLEAYLGIGGWGTRGLRDAALAALARIKERSNTVHDVKQARSSMDQDPHTRIPTVVVAEEAQLFHDSAVDAETIEEYSAQVQEAVLRSKVEASRGLDVLLLSLSGHTPDVKKRILESPDLAEARTRVAEESCQLAPEWANGALLLVPLRQDQALEARMELRPHHVVILQRDRQAIESTLMGLPKRRRPRIKSDHPAPVDSLAGDESLDAAITKAPSVDSLDDVDLHMNGDVMFSVENTFLNFYMAKPLAETPARAESAPGGCAV
jgi:hypothetical protein